MTFERGEIRLVVKDVPARVCPSCGEAYVEEDAAVKLLCGAEEIAKAGTLDTDHNYELLR